MKILKVVFLVSGLGVIFSSCGAHRGTMCPAYATEAGSSVGGNDVAVATIFDSEDLN